MTSAPQPKTINAVNYYTQGMTELSSGHLRKARSNFRRAVKDDPNKAVDIYSALALAQHPGHGLSILRLVDPEDKRLNDRGAYYKTFGDACYDSVGSGLWFSRRRAQETLKAYATADAITHRGFVSTYSSDLLLTEYCAVRYGRSVDTASAGCVPLKFCIWKPRKLYSRLLETAAKELEAGDISSFLSAAPVLFRDPPTRQKDRTIVARKIVPGLTAYLADAEKQPTPKEAWFAPHVVAQAQTFLKAAQATNIDK